MFDEENQDIELLDDEVIKAKDVSVYYDTRHSDDDFKSRLMNVFNPKKLREMREKRTTQSNKIWPLKDVSFAGYQGEILGVIGSNGAGKTTLSKVITGILRHDYGHLLVDGNVTALFSFGMGFNPELTGRENVYLNGMMLGIDKELIESYFDDIHAFSDLGDFIEQPMKYYSSGMKARLGFSVASHLQPEILILDEALNTGDGKFSTKAAEKMQELVQQAKIVIIITHSLRYAERIVIRLSGCIKEK